MKYCLVITAMILLIQPLSAATPIGKIVQIVGDVDLTSLSTGKKSTPKIGSLVRTDHKIRTGKRSFTEILLNDGTKLLIREITVLNVSTLKRQESDPPTRIKLLTGKVRVSLKKVFGNRALILKTPTALAGVRGTDFGVIASKFETRFLVYEGKVEVANENADIIKSYILIAREETSVKHNAPPTRPVTVPADMLREWFEHYDVDEENKSLIIRKKEEGFIDKLLRKRNF